MNEEGFKKLRVGASIKYTTGKKIKVLPSKIGCEGCSFRNEFGAKQCHMSQFCIGHLRPDKTPVIFVVHDMRGKRCSIK